MRIRSRSWDTLPGMYREQTDLVFIQREERFSSVLTKTLSWREFSGFCSAKANFFNKALLSI